MNEPMHEAIDEPTQCVSIEEAARNSLRDLREGVCRRYERCEERVRRSPTASVVGAMAVGCLLHRLPVRTIVVSHVRLLSALIPPALFLYGAAKLYDCLQKKGPRER
jgi:hypothetical protein